MIIDPIKNHCSVQWFKDHRENLHEIGNVEEIPMLNMINACRQNTNCDPSSALDFSFTVN